ncbi:MarR family winged helix-turn-helix transcriptional regulator [uncultured Jatrophihabitans sp.]|uniref:MarR family winged helix-turn-helix transcriptional regulator n=1 Tax=uncultured Jatrophihabitans sp. TaxID=1610747 RepID=UPI0035C9D0CB
MDERDIVDELVEQWRHVPPHLGDEAYEAMATIGRLTRIGLLLAPLIERTFASYDIARGEFDVLGTLLRQGRPYTTTPTVMARLHMLSPGAMTNRLDRLEKAGYVQRAHDPDNRRSVLVSLTPRGRELAETALEAHVQNEKQLLSVLNLTDRRRLDTALRRFLNALES